MAESRRTSLLQPQEFKNSRGIKGIFVPGVFLSIGKLEEMLNDPKNMENIRADEIKSNIAKCKHHDFQHMQVSFPVEKLQHVTVGTALEGIIDQEGFIPSRHEEETRPGFKDLSFWSAQISKVDIGEGRQRANDNVNSVVTAQDVQTYHGDIEKQFAKSPAFDLSGSRYGQYKFSFQLSDLLTWYGDQFCNGGKPQLRIVGTDIYKQEIFHYIVVHGPDTDLYNNLPMVPTVQTEEDSLHFAYLLDKKLYWRPESTSQRLYVKILKDGSLRKECYNRNCPYFKGKGHCFHTGDGIYCPWNHLGIAFHVPEDHHLKISRTVLLDNLTASGKLDPYLGKESDPDPTDVVNEIKDKFKDWKEN